MRARWAPILLGTLVLVGCGADEGAAPDDAGTPGTRLVFDLRADLSDPAHVFDAPYPSDLRLDADGHPEVAGWPNPNALGIIEGFVQSAREARGFPAIPVAHFRFDGPLAARNLDDVIAAEPAAPILLVDVDPDSPERGRLFPVVAQTTPPDPYVPEFVLSVAPRPGFVLRPETTYAVVVQRAAKDASGSALGVPAALARVLRGTPSGAAEQRASQVFAPLGETLDTLGVSREDVAAATVFTTGDVVRELAELVQKVVAKYDVTLQGLAPHDDPEVKDLCIVTGSVEMPAFQTGTPPYADGGRFVFDGSGLPIEQRKEKAPFKIVLPKGMMPVTGYPLVVNVHGSGGYSIAMVRPVGADGKPGAPIGPAFPYAQRGFAVAGMAMPLNPERLPGASETAYLNANNLQCLRDNFRQGVLELGLFLEALGKLEIPPSALGTCTGPTLPPGATHFRFDPQRLGIAGQSMGGMYANLAAAVLPELRAAVPTGAGGHWTHFIFHTPLSGGSFPGLLKLVLGGTEPLSFVHPALALGAAALEAGDPVVFVPRIARRPLPDHPVRPIYQPCAPEDSYFDTRTYDVMALAYGHPQAGEPQWSSMQEALALANLDGLVPLPLANNLKSEDGRPYTGAVLQFAPAAPPGEVADGHAIYIFRNDVKYQYSCFLHSFFATGTARIPVPKNDFALPCE